MNEVFLLDVLLQNDYFFKLFLTKIRQNYSEIILRHYKEVWLSLAVWSRVVKRKPYFIYMDLQKQLTNLQEEIANRTEMIKTVIANLQNEARRISSTFARYSSQKKSDGIFGGIDLNNPDFKELSQYSQLLSKQFIVKLQGLLEQCSTDKRSLEKLGVEFKKSPGETYGPRIEALKDSAKKTHNYFCKIWSDQHFLVLNYRLDIAAKELQRWTAVMQHHQTQPGEITAQIEELFK